MWNAAKISTDATRRVYFWLVPNSNWSTFRRYVLMIISLERILLPFFWTRPFGCSLCFPMAWSFKIFFLGPYSIRLRHHLLDSRTCLRSLSKVSVGDCWSRAYPNFLSTSIYFSNSVNDDNGHSEPVANSPWRRFITRDLCSSPLQHSTIVPWGNVASFGSLLPIRVPGEWRKKREGNGGLD